jgi:6-pyruvoyltetrahydropterin/6-carboxytetrahydropterin synthase
LPTDIYKVFHLEAAHRLPNVPEGHKCARLHGHSFRVEIHLRGEPDPTLGWVMDFADLKAAFAPVMDARDHRDLNEVPGLEYPARERPKQRIWERLRPALPLLTEVPVQETCTAGASYRGP